MAPRRELILGSRGSALARVQSQQVADQLSAAGMPTRLQIIRTRGDAIVDRPFTDIPGKGFFTQEIEAALRAGEVDLAVHSLKDLPTEAASGLQIVAIPPRQDARDCLIVAPDAYAAEAAHLPLRPAARVGTSAVRRAAQLSYLRPDLDVRALRGNVTTRVARLRDGMFDAIVLAQAGINRLGLDLAGLQALPLPTERFVPAPGQGALALQGRHDDAELRALCAPLHGATAAAYVQAERAILARVEGGCHAPLGAYVSHPDDGAGLQMLLFYAPPGRPLPLRACLRAADLPTLQRDALVALQGVDG